MAAGDSGSVVADSSAGQNDKDNNGVHAESFTLAVLQIVKEAQQVHGLRHGDYQRYRQYCARRIKRIRKSLHFPQGTKHRVQPKKITEDSLKDVRYLYLPLVDAERAWAYAMQLKSEANTETRKKFHLISRLKKAVAHTDLLVALCESDKCDARTKLEAKAYCDWMKGALYFELENWKAAMECYTSAKMIYEKLAGAFVDEIKDIYLQRVEELSPNIRYCAYNIGDESAIDDLRQMRRKAGQGDPLTSRLDELIEKTREKQAATLSEVTWRGRTVPVKNEQVRVFLLSIPESEKQLKEADSTDSKVSICETLLKELIEAQQSLREELREDPHWKAVQRGQKTDEKVSNPIYLHTYLTYLKQTKTIERNLLMIDTLKARQTASSRGEEKRNVKPQDLARLYDIIIQNLIEIPNLPGLEDDERLTEEVEIQISGFKAFRCFYVAQTYRAAKKWKESIALYEQVLNYGRLASSGLEKATSPVMKKLYSEVGELMNEVEGLRTSVHASSILDMEDVTAAAGSLSLKSTNKKPLMERLDEYVENPSLMGKKPNLVTFPPDFEPIPCKPLFFDLALSHIEFPSLDDKLEQKKAAGGITGFVKGWLWGGKK